MASGVISVITTSQGDFKVYKIFRDKDGLDKYCLNLECYDFLIPYTSIDKEDKKLKLEKLNLSFKEIDINISGENKQAFFVIGQVVKGEGFSRRGVPAIISKISEFLPGKSVAEMKRVSKSSSKAEYKHMVFKNTTLTQDFLRNLMKQTSIETLILDIKPNINDIKEIDLRPLTILKKIEYNDSGNLQKITIRFPDSITHMIFVSLSTILGNYPAQLKNLDISVDYWRDDIRTSGMFSLHLPSLIETMKIRPGSSGHKKIAWINYQQPYLMNLRYLDICHTSPTALIIPPNLIELICGCIVTTDNNGNVVQEYLEQKSFEGSKLEILKLMMKGDKEVSLCDMPERKDFILPRTLKRLEGVLFSSLISVDKIRDLPIEYLRCELYNLDISVLNFIGGTLKTLILDLMGNEPLQLDTFSAELEGFPLLENLTLYSYETTGNLHRIMNSNIKTFILFTYIPDTSNLRVDFDGFLKLSYLEVNFLSVIPRRLPDSLVNLKLRVWDYERHQEKAKEFKDSMELMYPDLHVSIETAMF